MLIKFYMGFIYIYIHNEIYMCILYILNFILYIFMLVEYVRYLVPRDLFILFFGRDDLLSV